LTGLILWTIAFVTWISIFQTHPVRALLLFETTDPQWWDRKAPWHE
jgi:hypothetical protein